MTFRRAALCAIAPLALAACALGPAVPQQVELDAEVLTVQMSDGSVCLGPASGPDMAAGWTGQLQDCAWDYAYTVEIDQGTNPVRLILQEVFGELGGGGLLAPIAEVTITSADGRDRRFQTPDRPED